MKLKWDKIIYISTGFEPNTCRMGKKSSCQLAACVQFIFLVKYLSWLLCKSKGHNSFVFNTTFRFVYVCQQRVWSKQEWRCGPVCSWGCVLITGRLVGADARWSPWQHAALPSLLPGAPARPQPSRPGGQSSVTPVIISLATAMKNPGNIYQKLWFPRLKMSLK